MIEHTQDASFLPDQATEKDGPKSSAKDHGPRRRLNPAFVCELMAWPWFWTNPEPISFAREETELLVSKARRHLLNLFGEPELRDEEPEEESDGW
jgi:hypothetical protein